MYALHPCRCVLAASSPVLASVLSSAGALVELQDPCLSDSVLALVLDYIYTGTLPYTHTQQQYYSLLSAACYLQMDVLQDTLRTKVNPANFTKSSNESAKDTVNTLSKHLSLSDSCSAPSLETERQYWDGIDTMGNLSSGPSACENTVYRVNTTNCNQVTYVMPQDLNQSTTIITDEGSESGVDKEFQNDGLHSVDPVNPKIFQMNTDELVGTGENRRSLYTLHTAEAQEEETDTVESMQRPCLREINKSKERKTNRKEEDEIHHGPVLGLSTSQPKNKVSPPQCLIPPPQTSLQPCCGAVPVICYSSSAAAVEVSTTTPQQLLFPPSFGCDRALDSPSGSTDIGRIDEGITTKFKNEYGAQNSGYRNNQGTDETKPWDYMDRSDQCAQQDSSLKSNADQYRILKRNNNSSHTDHDEHMGSWSSCAGDDDGSHSLYNLFQNCTKYLGDDAVPPNKDHSSVGLKSKPDLLFNNFPSTNKPLNSLDCKEKARELPSSHPQDPRATDSLPLQELHTGTDSPCKDVSCDVEAKENHSYLRRYPAEMDGQQSHDIPVGPNNDSYPNLRRAEKCTEDPSSIQNGRKYRDTAIDNVAEYKYLDNKNVSGTDISESHLNFRTPLDKMSDPEYNVTQSYCGHLHYHCLPQEVTHSDHKHSHPHHPDDSDQVSDQDEDASPVRRQFASPDKILLLDISTKPAELLLSYRSDKQEEWVAFTQKQTSENGIQHNDRHHEATLVEAVCKRKKQDGIKFGADSFDEAETKLWGGETNVENMKSAGKDPTRLGAKAGGKDGEDQAAILTVCSPLSVPDTVKASIPSTLSFCIPSSLSTNMPTNISPQLSTPVHHPFKCTLCYRSFSQRGSLNRHVRSHLGIRPFPCPRCPMTFSRQYRVMEHMRVHKRCVLGSDFQKPSM